MKRHALAAVALFAGCLPMPPLTASPMYRARSQETTKVSAASWLLDPRPGDRYVVAGSDLVWRQSTRLGPADNATGRCEVTAEGDVYVTAPLTPGEWPCLLRACRETCIVARVTVVVEP